MGCTWDATRAEWHVQDETLLCLESLMYIVDPCLKTVKIQANWKLSTPEKKNQIF